MALGLRQARQHCAAPCCQQVSTSPCELVVAGSSESKPAKSTRGDSLAHSLSPSYLKTWIFKNADQLFATRTCRRKRITVNTTRPNFEHRDSKRNGIKQNGNGTQQQIRSGLKNKGDMNTGVTKHQMNDRKRNNELGSYWFRNSRAHLEVS